MSDEFDDPWVAQTYDALDPDRGDLDVYVAIVEELGGRSVLDVGCGTGTFALMLVDRGIDAIGVDPAAAMLDVARARPGADRVRWIEGVGTSLPRLAVDVVTMTANVAQVFVADDEWDATLRSVYDALRPGGWLVFESRDPAQRAWESWTPDATRASTYVDGFGPVETWIEVTSIAEPTTVSFTSHLALHSIGRRHSSTSTLRFRTEVELRASLERTGFLIREVRDASDRPGREFVFLAQRMSRS